MTTEIDILLKAVDEASAVLSGAADKIKGSMGQVEGANVQLDQTQKKTDASAKDLAVGFSGVATSAFALYMTIDRVEKSNYALEKANLAVSRSNETVEAAQKTYNVALEKYGATSGEAKNAADKLAIAQEANSLAIERVNLAQGNVNQAMIQGALTVIPSVITMVSSAIKITESWSVAQAIFNAIMDANPIAIVILAIAGLVAALILAYNYCEPFKNAVNALGKALGDYLGPVIEAIRFSLEWLWNNVLVPLGNFIYSAFVAYINALVGAFQWLSDVLKPVTDAIWGFFNAVNGAISAAGSALAGFTSWFGGAVSGLCSAVVETVASMTGQSDALTEAWAAKSVADVEGAMNQQLAAVQAAYDAQTATIDAALQQQLTAIDTFYSTLQADAKTAFDTQYADFLNYYQSQLEPAQETELQKLVDKWVEHFDTQIADMNEAYNKQISDTNAFYNSLIDAANVKLSAIRDARKADLDDLELNNLLQKQALKLAFDEGELSTEDYNKAVAALDKNYNALRKDINDDYRLKELQAEKNIKTETTTINQERATAVEGITTMHTIAVLGTERAKSARITEIEAKDKLLRTDFANTTAQLEQAKADETRLAVVAAEEKKTAAHEKFEGQTKTIVATAEAEKTRIIKAEQQEVSNKTGGWMDNLSSMWGNFTGGVGTSWKGLCDGLSSWWSGASSAISDSVGGFCAGVTDWFNGLSAAITGGSIWPDMLESMTKQANSGLDDVANEFKVGLGLVQGTVESVDSSTMANNLEETGRRISGTMDEIQKQYEGIVVPTVSAPKINTGLLPEGGAAAPAVGVRDTLMRAIGTSERPSVSIQISAPLVNIEGSADRATADLAASMVQERLRNVIVEATSSGAPATSKMIRIGNKVGTI